MSEQLQESFIKVYPNLKKMKRIKPKTLEDLKEEAEKVEAMMREIPRVPKQSGEVYHVVAMSWLRKWRRYVGLDT